MNKLFYQKKDFNSILIHFVCLQTVCYWEGNICKEIENSYLLTVLSSISPNKLKKELNIFNLNIWGVSYFDDAIPLSPIDEKFNITSVRQSFVNVSISYLELGLIFAITVLIWNFSISMNLIQIQRWFLTFKNTSLIMRWLECWILPRRKVNDWILSAITSSNFLAPSSWPASSRRVILSFSLRFCRRLLFIWKRLKVKIFQKQIVSHCFLL